MYRSTPNSTNARRRSSTYPTFDWNETSFSSSSEPDLTFSFEPKQLRLRNSEVPEEEEEEEGEEEEREEEGSDEEENPFELASELQSEGERLEEGAGSEEDCQVVEASREVIERVVTREEDGKSANEELRNDDWSRQRRTPTSIHESETEQAPSGPTEAIRFPRPATPTLEPSPTSSNPSQFPTSPPRHDVTGRLLPSAPPPLLPFEIPAQTPPRSPRSRFGSSTLSITRSFSNRFVKNREDDTIGSDTYWDTTTEIDTQQLSLPPTPGLTSTSNSRGASEPSSTPTSKASLVLPSPPLQARYSDQSSATIRPQSLALRRNLPLPSPFLETPSYPPQPSSSPLHSPSSPLQPINRSPSGYFRLPLTPSPLTPNFPLPPHPPPPSVSTPSTSFPFPPIHPPSFSPLGNFPQTPTTASLSTTFDHNSNPSHRRQSRSNLLLPEFVSVFMNHPNYSNDIDVFMGEGQEETPPSSFLNGSKPSEKGRHAELNPSIDIGVGEKGATARHRRTWTLAAGEKQGEGVSLVGDHRVETWLRGVSKEREDSKDMETSTLPSDSRRGGIRGQGRKGRNGKVGFEKKRSCGRFKEFSRTKRGKWILLSALVVSIAVIVGIGAAVGRAGKGDPSTKLNATCVELEGNSIAQAFIDLAETSSTRWQPPIDPIRLAFTLNRYVYPAPQSISTTSCDSQISLLDIPSLSHQPNRLLFSQLTLVHTLALTESNTTIHRLERFISSLSLTGPLERDEPAPNSNSNYEIISGGFTWDFATMERTVQNVSWKDVMKPNDEELQRMEGKLEGLDRVTPFAVASSSQRSTALENYWVDTLGMEAEDLEKFRSIVRDSEVLIPFGEDVKSIEALLAQENDELSILEGIGCRRDLAQEVVDRVNSVENGVFGLSKDPSTSNETCSSRPIYGIVNLLRLSTPFPPSLLSSRPSLPKNSLVLAVNASDRVSFHAGETLVGGPSALPTSPLPTSLSVPTSLERFGLSSRLDHVLLDYLNLLDIDIAKLLIERLFSTQTTSPSNDFALSDATNGLADIPILEVQLWGGLRWDDVKGVSAGS
ncbi:hypothetical protein JCM16303_003653 [Sporobolomyces ruberrimus]